MENKSLSMKKLSLKSERKIFQNAEAKPYKMRPAGDWRRMLKKLLVKESKMTRVHSLEILKEFEMLH
jgi:hypothetical protein